MNKVIEQKKEELRNKKIKEIREKIIDKKIREALREKKDVNKDEIENEVNEIMEGIEENLDINIKYLVNPDSQQKGILKLEIKFKDDNMDNDLLEYLCEEYYDLDLNLIATKNRQQDIVLSEKYRDIPDIIEQIENMEELDNVLELAKEHNIDVSKLTTANLDQKLKEKEDIEQFEADNKQGEKEELTKSKEKKLSLDKKQELDTSTIIDGRQSLGNVLELEEYSKIYIVYSEKVTEVQNIDGTKNYRNNSKYSLIGVRADGTAKVLDKEFEMDRSSGINSDKESIRFNDDNTVQMDNKIESRYIRKGTNQSISMYQDKYGEVKAFYEPGTTMEKNTRIGMQIETSETKSPYMDKEQKEVIDPRKGKNNLDNIEKEAKKNNLGDEKIESQQADGIENEENISFEYIESYIEKAKKEIMQDEDISDVFSENEVETKLTDEIYLQKIASKEDLEKAKEKVKAEMGMDAEILKEHGRTK